VKWHYKDDDGKHHGPLSKRIVKAYIKESKTPHMVEVRSDKDYNWGPACVRKDFTGRTWREKISKFLWGEW
jgi:hypothetical protein